VLARTHASEVSDVARLKAICNLVEHGKPKRGRDASGVDGREHVGNGVRISEPSSD
jgi:hypothetical protein